MFDLFKKKSDMMVFNLEVYIDESLCFTMIWKIPKYLERIFRDSSTKVNENLLTLNYLRLKPDRFKDENLWISSKWNRIEIDVEKADCNFWVSSERFKEFSEKENLWFEFFPILVENKRKYLMSWRALPAYWSYDLDLEETEFHRFWIPKGDPNRVFRSDVIEYYNWKIFCDSWHIYKYITWEIKDKMEQENCRETLNSIQKTWKSSIKSSYKKKIWSHRRSPRTNPNRRLRNWNPRKI